MGSSGLVSACLLVDSLRHFIFNEGRALLTCRSTCTCLPVTDEVLFRNQCTCDPVFGFLSRGQRMHVPRRHGSLSARAPGQAPGSRLCALWNVHSVDNGPQCFRSNCPANGCAPLCSLRPVKISLSPNTLAGSPASWRRWPSRV